MKKILYLMVFILSLFSYTSTFSYEYNNKITISNAVLIENYIKKHKIRIKDFIDKYHIKDTNHLESSIKELDESIIVLNKIKNGEINPEKSSKIIQAIIKRIKYINDDLRQKLNKEKYLFKNTIKRKKNIYSNLGIKLSNKIDEINIKIFKSVLSNKNIYNPNKKNIKNILIKLNKESKKLKYFGNINFKSEKEIKDSFVRILINIKRYVNIMKKDLK